LRCLTASIATVPGVKIRISQAGLNYGATVAVDVLSARVTGLSVPNVHESAKWTVGDVNLQVTNMRVKHRQLFLTDLE